MGSLLSVRNSILEFVGERYSLSKMKPITAIGFSLVLLLSCATISPPPPTVQNKEIYTTNAGVEFLEKYQVAILDSSDRAIPLEEELKDLLIESGKVTVIDRKKTADALNEISLSLQGLADKENAPKIGKLLSAQKLIQIKESGRKWAVELVDVQTSKIDFNRSFVDGGSQKAFQELVGFLSRNLLLRNLSGLRPKQSSIKVSLGSSRKLYKNNDPVSFEVKVSEDCYLYLILLQSDGESILLFPNDSSPSNFAKAGETILIPDGKSGYILTAGEPFGSDMIKAIASKKSLNLFDSTPVPGTPFGKIVNPFDVISRGIKKINTEIRDEDWNTAEITIQTEAD
ncbi:PF14326 domain protein [Leptospira fainei serovar Hurstbridge str. BUT 6]|uniref:PF14326 domain protein n=1 Tax=Leptospira fainei serovar Hurstbridge str. BUT 6 TaxID=1193011 RepID=S3VDR3_9LEPT|nr:DUF4384 domain-containing protein [Leptospira fainei]EPG74625.1 PF14326 domain protein [Leptospira fainei serovar Hurstbridge str. BUT 6]